MTNQTHRITIDVIGDKAVATLIRHEIIALLDSIRPLEAAYSIGAVQSPKSTKPNPLHYRALSGRWDNLLRADPVLADSQDTLDAGSAPSSDAEAHYARPTAGTSLPGECVHSMFAIGRSRYKCCHCHVVVDFGEQGEE